MADTTYYSLTNPQQRICYTEILQPGTGFANIACSVRLKKGAVNLGALKKAINLAIQRNDALRIRLVPGDGELRQYVAAYREIDLELLQGPDMEERLKEQSQTPFVLYDADLFYFALLKYDEENCGFYIKLHHAISDGFSFAILTKQIVEYYQQIVVGQPGEEKPKPSFFEYFKREEAYLNSAQCAQDRAYWLRRLENLPEPLNMRFSPAKTGMASIRKVFCVPEELRQEIDAFCRQHETTLFRFMTAVLYVYLSRAYGSNDLIIGTAYYNRVSRQELNTVGMFVSTIPMRIPAEEKLDFTGLLELVHSQLTADMAHQQYPYNLLVRDLREAGQKTDNLLDINIVQIPNGKDDKYVIEAWHQGADPAMLNMVINPNQLTKGAALEIALDYRKDLFDDAEVARLYGHLLAIVRDALRNPRQTLGQLQIMPEEEKQQVLVDFNNIRLDIPPYTTYQEVFARSVEAYPDRPALVFRDTVYTYRELDEKTNQLARLLRTKGVKPDDRVAIMVSRSADIMIGALAIMKAGGAYLPVDPDYPADRIRYMLEDSGAQVLLSQHHLKNKAEGFSGVWLDLGEEDLYAGEGTTIANINKPSDLAYVIYTSGSTGKPKGVMIEHRNLINLCCSHNLTYSLTDADSSAAYIAFGFDGSVVSLFPPLAVGACVHIIPEEMRLLLDELNQYFEDNRITITVLPTQFCEQFVELVDNKSLKALVTGGEKLKVYKQRNYLMANEYGPTENTVDATGFIVNKPYANIPIGKPRHNVWAYVVDKQGHPQPVGVPGELWLAGAQIARGYLNRPELTAEKFVANPFAVGAENARVYKTGDLVRWLPDGNLEFLGRIDQQVKIRGYRIELGEIEQRLLQYPGITEAVVLDCDEAGGAKFLCAYVVAATELGDEDLKAFLGIELPDYMVPAHFIWLDRIPMTVNGKVDKRALREMSKGISTRAEYVAPRNEGEEKMAALWREVLDIEQVGIDDDFFSLGGHSLKATRLAAVVQKSFGVRMPITEIFQQPTIRQLCQAVAGMMKSAYPDIVPVPQSEYYPLSSAQKRMFVMEQMEDIGTTYNIAGAYIITGQLDKERLRAAVDRLAARHDVLRTAIVVVDGEPVQQVRDVKIELNFSRCAWGELSGMLKRFVQKFDLAHAPLLRLELADLGDAQHALLYNAHHIIFDGLSMEIFLKELLSLYEGRHLPELKYQYRDYATWQNHLLDSEIMAEQEQFWLDVFSGELPVLNMPFDYPRPPVQRHEGRSLTLRLDHGMLEKIQSVADKNQVTLFMFLFAAYNILLSKYSGQDDIVVGTPASGRTHPDLEEMIGMFVGTLPVRSQPAGDKTFSQYLGETKQLILTALHNQDYPLEKLVEKLKIKRDASRNPLFDAMFSFSQEDNPSSADGALTTSCFDAERVSAHFDVDLEARRDARGLELLFEYATSLFTEQTISRLGQHFVNILETITEDPAVRLCDIAISSLEERQQVLVAFNENRLDCSANITYHEMFMQTALKFPANKALVFKNDAYTYRELDEKTNKLARLLRAKGVGPDDRVAIMVSRSADIIVGALAIMKAGGAYLPIDPDYPAERVRYMLEDSGAQIMLSQQHLKDKAAGFDGTWLDLGDANLYQGDGTNLENINKSCDLAYIIYTSGSTGKPKGVMISHAGLINLVTWHNSHYQINEKDISAAFSSFSFDVSVKQMFPFLLTGAGVHILSEQLLLDIAGLNAYFEDNGITFTDLPTQLAEAFMENCDNKSLRYLTTGGDKLRSYTPRSYQLVNEYGPTEFTVSATYFAVDRQYANIPIGKPLGNCWAYVVDKQGMLQPIGVPGELCMAGPQIARGYLHRPELTAEKFVPNPYAVCPENALMYKTGDLVRWLPDGNLEYLGRIDMQVKIRGYRIELGEIERAVLNCPDIANAVVIDRLDEDGNKYLCSYLVAEKTIDIEKLKQFIAQDLPHYMVPGAFLQIPSIPYNASGKVDRRALPAPDLAGHKREYVAPRNEAETKMAAIWQEVLGVGQVGIEDDFFSLGGHSLKVAVLINKVKKAFNADVAFTDVFSHSVLKDFVVLVNNAGKNSLPPIGRSEKLPAYPLLAPQKKMLDFALKHAGNSPLPLEINGPLDVERLWRAFDFLVERHEILRTAIDFIDGQPVQIVADKITPERKIRQVDLRDIEPALREFMQPFKINEPPLWRAELWILAPDKYIFMLDLHHIIFDGSSVGIFMRELAAAYAGKQLPPLEIQFRDYAIWQDKLLKTGGFRRMEEYWLQTLAGARSSLELPTDWPRQAVPNYEGETVIFDLSPEMTRQVHDLALQAKTTAHVVIMAVYAVLLAKRSGKRDIVFEEGIAGRNYPEVENLIGMFVNVIPMRSLPQAEKTFRAFLAEMNETLLRGYECQEYPVAELADKLSLQVDADLGSLQFDAGYVYQNMDIPEIKTEDWQMRVYPLPAARGVARRELLLVVNEAPGQLRMSLVYRANLFEKSTMEGMAGDFRGILAAVLTDPDKHLADLL